MICLYAKNYTKEEAIALEKDYRDLAERTYYTGDKRWGASLTETADYLKEEIEKEK